MKFVIVSFCCCDKESSNQNQLREGKGLFQSIVYSPSLREVRVLQVTVHR